MFCSKKFVVNYLGKPSLLKETFIGSFLQHEVTGVHASHFQNSFIDPADKGGHLSVDVKDILLKSRSRLNLEKQVTSAQSQATDPPRLTRPTRTPSTVRAPPLSPWKCLVVTFILKKKILLWLPYVAAAFLCAEHALTDVAPICLNICLALAFTKDWNLRWRWSGFFFFSGNSRKICPKRKAEKEKRPHLNFFESVRCEVSFSQAPT